MRLTAVPSKAMILPRSNRIDTLSADRKMDPPTRAYYEQFADEIAQRYDSVEPEMSARLRRVFAPGDRVLDVGAGSGRDVSLLLEMGCDAYGVEPTDALREVAQKQHPALSGRLAANSLPQLGQPFGGNFGGVLCSAVFMHLRKAEILDAAISLRSILKQNGKLLLSVPLQRPGLDAQSRDAHGRLFTPLPPAYLQLLFERIGFDLIEKWESSDSLGREGVSWCTFLFQRPASQWVSAARSDRRHPQPRSKDCHIQAGTVQGSRGDSHHGVRASALGWRRRNGLAH